MTDGQLVSRWKAPGLPVIVAVIFFTSAFAHGASLTASWVDNSFGVARTRIERRVGADPAFQVIADLPPGVTVYVDAAVVAGQTYCYRALAHDRDLISPYSEEACAVATEGFAVRVGKSGDGKGTVTSAPAGISCGSVCSAGFPNAGAVVLSATPDALSTFLGWSGGGCAGTQPCAVAANGTVAVTASFAPLARAGGQARISPSPLAGRCPLPAGMEVGLPYSMPCAVTGGSPPYSCVLTGGALPPGLSLERECRISGSPTRAGVTTFTARIADASGRTVNYTGSATALASVRITTATLPHARVGHAFSAALHPMGGRGPYRWAVVDGTLPPGLELDPSRGIVAGRPTAVGVNGFTLRVRDALGATSDRTLRLVTDHGPLTATCVLGMAKVGVAFVDACEPRAGLPPYSCAVAHGMLPPGLTLNPDCTLRGVPAIAGVGAFGTRVSDSGGTSIVIGARIVVQPHGAVATSPVPFAGANPSYSAVVAGIDDVRAQRWMLSDGSGPLTATPRLGITTGFLPYAIVRQSLRLTLAAAGGTPPYTWSLVEGALPEGLGLDLSEGVIGGMPAGDGIAAFTIRVRDALGAVADRSYRLVVSDRP